MRNQGAPQVSGNLMLTQVRPSIQAKFLWPCSASFEIIAPGFGEMYNEDSEVGHRVWVNGRVIGTDGSLMFLKCTVVAPCDHIKAKHWDRVNLASSRFHASSS
ncbi:hypothetical protein PGT21_006528 [Puccinia graminis f. sp. tritici]|uniref:Uncharacterized protein n=1 Tax=Puccinia graminis f. sp. tritici TaxID=56615 RepID=A0A5B0NR25_PUCGR|nr:hypothetical protein PGTUg99_028899 [Puccinia graminis f. sp. tritici]KAA1090600.1 hypothetical protein PGT21_006528 [Puccinia graminis f. sp. tritici]